MVRQIGNRLSFDRRGLLRAAIGAAFLAPKVANAQAPQQVGSVEDIKGEAFADSRDKRRTLERAAPLYLTDVVATGPDSRLVLHLGSMTTLKLGASSRLTIDKFLVNVGGEITLQSGPILFDRPEGSPPTDMQFHSSFGLIAVRGALLAGPSNNVFGVFVRAAVSRSHPPEPRSSCKRAREPTLRSQARPQHRRRPGAIHAFARRWRASSDLMIRSAAARVME